MTKCISNHSRKWFSGWFMRFDSCNFLRSNCCVWSNTFLDIVAMILLDYTRSASYSFFVNKCHMSWFIITKSIDPWLVGFPIFNQCGAWSGQCWWRFYNGPLFCQASCSIKRKQWYTGAPSWKWVSIAWNCLGWWGLSEYMSPWEGSLWDRIYEVPEPPKLSHHEKRLIFTGLEKAEHSLTVKQKYLSLYLW